MVYSYFSYGLRERIQKKIEIRYEWRCVSSHRI